MHSLLIWIYVAWVIVLLGAVITAYLPSLLAGVSRRAVVPGWRFRLSLEMLQALVRAPRGLTLMQLAEQLHVDPLQLEPLVENLVTLDWVGRLLDDDAPAEPPRLVLLAEPSRTPLAPLLQTTLLPREASTEIFWHNSGLTGLGLGDALSQR